jgi:hypothetical protein
MEEYGEFRNVLSGNFSLHSVLMYCHWCMLNIATEKCMVLSSIITQCMCAIMKFIYKSFCVNQI